MDPEHPVSIPHPLTRSVSVDQLRPGNPRQQKIANHSKMNAMEFNTYWETHFSGCPPVGYLLRENYPERWFRIHTLPQSKRYPDSEDEYREILHRHNTLLSDLFGSKTIYLVVTGFSSTKRPAKPKISRVPLSLSYAMSAPMHEIEYDKGEKRYWHFWASLLPWEAGGLDFLLQQVADDKIANLLLADPQNDQLYHPYDGGADIFLETQERIPAYKAKYQNWLSAHPSGL